VTQPLLTGVNRAAAACCRYVYEHFWQPGDFVVYDNRSTIHSTVAYDGDRHLHLMGFKGAVGQKGKYMHTRHDTHHIDTHRTRARIEAGAGYYAFPIIR